jgi:hypothetical protein
MARFLDNESRRDRGPEFNEVMGTPFDLKAERDTSGTVFS